MRSFLLPSLVLLLSPLASAVGQEARLAPGQRVRVTAHTCQLRRTPVTFVAFRADSMHVRYVKKRLDHGSVVTDSLSAAVPLAAVTKLEVPAGRRSNWDKGARSGAIVGGLVGLGFGALLVADCGDDRGLLCPGDGGEQAKAIVVSAAVLGMAGGVLGTVIGAMSSREVWQEVPVGRPRVAVFPTPTGLAVGAAIRF